MCVVLLDLGAPPFVLGSNPGHALLFDPRHRLYSRLVLSTMARRNGRLWQSLVASAGRTHSMARMVSVQYDSDSQQAACGLCPSARRLVLRRVGWHPFRAGQSYDFLCGPGVVFYSSVWLVHSIVGVYSGAP